MQSGEDAEERRLATAIAAHQPDAVALVNGERGGVEDDARVVAHGDFGGGEDGGHDLERLESVTDRAGGA